MSAHKNKLIQLLSAGSRQRLLAQCEPVELMLSDVLWERGAPIPDIYFPTDGFVSLVTQMDDHPGVEVGMVGREGLVGMQAALGSRASSSLRALVQGGGQALRIGIPSFRKELARTPELQRILDGYVTVLMSQLASSAGCLRVHKVGPRLARWLLMTQDRANKETFRITHEFLAYMLGVRRVGITQAASGFQQNRLIHYQRGLVTILDRAGLEAASCSCYAADAKAYRQMIGAFKKR